MSKKLFTLIFTREKNDSICDFVKQSCSALVKDGNLVVLINIANALSIKEVIFDRRQKRSWQFMRKYSGFYQVSPLLILPFRRFYWIYNLNLSLNVIYLYFWFILKFKAFSFKKVAWFFFPRVSVRFLAVARLLSLHTHFDIVDFFSFKDKKADHEVFLAKQRLLREVDTVSAISHVLKDKYLELVQREIKVVPQGFSNLIFQNYRKLNMIKTKPVVGFVGAINSRFDFELLILLAKKNKQWQFLFIGPKTIDPYVSSSQYLNPKITTLFSLSNVAWIDSLPKKYIASLVSFFDVAIIPYNIQLEFNKYCFPMKFFEYLYMQKNIVSTPIAELRRYRQYLHLANTVDEWEEAVGLSLTTDLTKARKDQLRSLAMRHSWDNKIKAIKSMFEL